MASSWQGFYISYIRFILNSSRVVVQARRWPDATNHHSKSHSKRTNEYFYILLANSTQRRKAAILCIHVHIFYNTKENLSPVWSRAEMWKGKKNLLLLKPYMYPHSFNGIRPQEIHHQGHLSRWQVLRSHTTIYPHIYPQQNTAAVLRSW